MATVLVGRRLVVAFLLSAAVLVAALAFESRALAVAAILLASLTLTGPSFPGPTALQGSVTVAAPHAIEEDSFPVKTSLRNGRRRTLVAEVRVVLPGSASVAEGAESGPVVLKGRSTASMEFSVKPHLFGLQRIGPPIARIGDPFGFAATEHIIGPSHDVRVFPRRETLREPVLLAKQLRAVLGRFEVARPGHGFDFFGLRDYHIGDRPRDVNWKASARIGSLIVNQRQKESDAEIVLLVDTRAASVVGRPTSSPYAQGCRAALAIAEAHMKGRDAVRFIAYGRTVVEDRHTGAARHLRGILDLTTSLDPGGDTPLLDVVHRILPSLRRRSPVMVFTSAMGDPSLREALSVLRSHEFPVSVFAARPDWGDLEASQGRLAWDARQKLEINALRRMGVAVADHGPGAPLAVSLANMELAA